MEPYLVSYRRGIHLSEPGLWLDPTDRRDLAVVSHAHDDHIARHDAVICTEATWRVLVHRTGRRRRDGRRLGVRMLSYGEETDHGSATISLHPAGHVLGSAQVLVRHRGVRVLYSGDIKLRTPLTAQPLEHVAADVLIVESTFGVPRFRFPPAETVVSAICDFCVDTLARGGIPVLFGYTFGKGQELLAALAGAELPVTLHPALYATTEIYRTLGVALPEARCFNVIAPPCGVVIWPPQIRWDSALRHLPRVRMAMISGWAVEPDAARWMGCDAAFPLSDHADFDDLCTYVERSGARQVYTVFGFAEELARELRRRGRVAHPLAAPEQLAFALA